ncbi:MAG TPA: GDSL-type esterase/lipase family protein [Baekduia sp.]|uniref:SGNH/GDSL hydrolase family protein n=1 Tax=Baekduia sp. TaxID=2600305 RepID=UPI002D0B1A11|nr:GDSL-type esterase/lipase family protein [Baekduia sp.]HMJ35088.1 GDSL-type esterase/lipase family protein [Baekduia sp.]
MPEADDRSPSPPAAGMPGALAGDPRGPVLGIGDSITCGPEEGAFGVPPRAWAQWLAEAQDLPFHRLAEPGAVTPWIAGALLPRARDDYALACLHTGTNDVRGPDWDGPAFEQALVALVDGLVARAARVCVATVPLDLGRPPAGPKVAELNAIVRRVAGERGATVVALDDLRGWRHFFPDAVHPTALGQLEIARRAARALDLTPDPATMTDVQEGKRADARYALSRQLAHLARDWRRRATERNV